MDAEVVDESEPQVAPEAARERLRRRAREFFGTATRKHSATTDRRRATDATPRVEADDADVRAQLHDLWAATRAAGEKYMNSLRDARLLVPGFNDEDREREFDAMHHVYTQMMMQACLKPLARGITPNAIIQAVGMMTAMRLLSPDFATEMDTYLQPLKDKIRERLDARAGSVRMSAELQAEKHNELVDARTAASVRRRPELADDPAFLAARAAKKTDRDAYLSARWRRRLADLEHRERGHRELFTTDTAAMTEVALAENAFWKMRDPHEDSDQIYASYRALRKRLRRQMADDGLIRQEVVTRARVIIGERMETEPEMRLMFNGIAHGRISKASTHQERIARTDRIHETWSGEFDDHLGDPIPDDAMFTVRRPMDAATHQAQLADTMATSMLDGLRRDDQTSYSGSVMGYLVGFAARKSGLDTRGLPDILRQRLDQSSTMLASMDIDGLSPEKQQEVYSTAFADAMDAVAASHPGVDRSLQLNFGPDWQSTLQAAVDDPAGFVHELRTRPRVYHTGPEHPAEQSAEFDWGWTARHAGADDQQTV
ncbi:hypothetical protein ACIQUM_07735 [Amycolatopsis azurea]|uniref:hypothetical protein n=1 Tax=Amycolatopsis azurea TaxID=36819 RepID=UPI003809F620